MGERPTPLGRQTPDNGAIVRGVQAVDSVPAASDLLFS